MGPQPRHCWGPPRAPRCTRPVCPGPWSCRVPAPGDEWASAPGTNCHLGPCGQCPSLVCGFHMWLLFRLRALWSQQPWSCSGCGEAAGSVTTLRLSSRSANRCGRQPQVIAGEAGPRWQAGAPACRRREGRCVRPPRLRGAPPSFPSWVHRAVARARPSHICPLLETEAANPERR